MNGELIYEERLTSNKTKALFLSLSSLFYLLYARRAKSHKRNALTAVSGFFAGLFLFYSLNFQMLVIRLTSEFLKLRFGIFTWSIPLDNIEDCRLDEIPILMRLGGAGIHFIMVGGRYRASFNFLEYPRILISLKNPAGPVRDISFSTRQPDRIIQLIHEAPTHPNI